MTTAMKTITETVEEAPDRQLLGWNKLLHLGFPDGVVAVCTNCRALEEFSIEDAAVRLTDSTWPRCCGKRCDMVNPASVLRY